MPQVIWVRVQNIVNQDLKNTVINVVKKLYQ